MENQLETITSIKDPRIVFARSLQKSINRQTQGACLLYGIQALEWALQKQWSICTIFSAKSSVNEITKFTHKSSCYLLSDGIMKKISNTAYLIPILAIAKIPDPTPENSSQPEITLMLERIQDHGNIGTIVRTACAFGIKHVILAEMDSDLYHRKTIEASRGAVFSMNSIQYQNSLAAINQLKQKGAQIIVTSPYGSKLQSELRIKNQPVVLVVGNESDGVSSKVTQLADACIQIPMQPEIESLNVGVAAGISIYEIKIKAVLAMLKQKIQKTLGREINVAGKLLLHNFEEQVDQCSHFTGLDAIFLMQLSCDHEMDIQQISRDTALFGQDLQTFIQKLEESNFIQSVRNKQNTWQITEIGKNWLAQIWPIVESSEKKAFQGFSQEEVNQFYDFMKRIQENCVGKQNQLTKL